MRRKYPGEGKSNKEGELLTILTEVVFLFLFHSINFDTQESQKYNAFEKDVAVVNIFFGSSTVFGLKNSAYFL